MEGNRLYEVLRKNGLTEASSEVSPLVVNAALVIIVLTAATLFVRRILLSVSRKWIGANRYRWDEALPVFDLRPVQNPTGYDMQHLAGPPPEASPA